jgi:hypothetical protein
MGEVATRVKRVLQNVWPGSVGSYTGININIVSEDMAEENHLVASISLQSR